MIIRFLICLMVLLISNIHAGTIDPKVPDSKYIEYGDKFPFVVQLFGTLKEPESSTISNFYGSAVLIDDHNFLTAAHAVKNAEVMFILIGNKAILVRKVIFHQSFQTKKEIGDIAIGYCDKPFGLKEYPALYTDNTEVNKKCSIAGFGLTGNLLEGSSISDNQRRAGYNTIDYISNDLLVCSPSYSNDKDYTELEIMIASGDSGGGLFIDNKLAGIHSCVMIWGKGLVPKSKYGEESGHTRVSKFIEWIEKNRVKKDE